MRTSKGTSSPLVTPESGWSSSPSTCSSATLVRYSWARCTGLRVWNPTTVDQPRSANAARVSAGVEGTSPARLRGDPDRPGDHGRSLREQRGDAGMRLVGGAVHLARLGLEVAIVDLGDRERAEQMTAVVAQGDDGAFAAASEP